MQREDSTTQSCYLAAHSTRKLANMRARARNLMRAGFRAA